MTLLIKTSITKMSLYSDQLVTLNFESLPDKQNSVLLEISYNCLLMLKIYFPKTGIIRIVKEEKTR